MRHLPCRGDGYREDRLAQEALTLARTRGFAVMEGRAYLLEGRLATHRSLPPSGHFCVISTPLDRHVW